MANIKINYKAVWLGRYETAEEAAIAYNKAAEILGYMTRNVIHE